MGVAAWSSLSPPLLLPVPMVDASVLLSNKQYTELLVLGALACFAKPECPWCRFFFAFLDLQFRIGMVWVYRGNGRVEGHIRFKAFHCNMTYTVYLHENT